MKILDADMWQQQRAEITTTDGEAGKTFLAFIEHWCGLAETVINRRDYGDTAIQALRDTFDAATRKYGTPSSVWLAQMLLVIAANWEHSPGMIDDMTVFERHPITQEAIHLAGEHATQAARAGNQASA